MQWRGRRASKNVVDKRGLRVSGRTPAIGLGGLVLVGLLAVALGADPGDVITALTRTHLSTSGSYSSPQRQRPKNDTAKAFVSTVLASTEDAWRSVLSEAGARYHEPQLVLFDGAIHSACGYSTAAVGPFYCPGDSKVYLDLDFFRELAHMGAAGDFAAAYVIAHEVGHHVQNLIGVLPRIQRAKQGLSQAEQNALQVKVELQADCFAGIWGFYANQQQSMLEEGDLQEGLDAAAAVGDDTLLRRAGRPVQPDAFTHGSSQQRIDWFTRGFHSGNMAACDTFGNG